MKIWFALLMSCMLFSCGGKAEEKFSLNRAAYLVENNTTYRVKMTYDFWPKDSRAILTSKELWIEPGTKIQIFYEYYLSESTLPTQPETLFKNINWQAHTNGTLVGKLSDLPYVAYGKGVKTDTTVLPSQGYMQHDFTITLNDSDFRAQPL